MEVSRALLAGFFFALAAGAFLLFGNPPAGPTLSNAALSPTGNAHALTVTITNEAGPDRLISVASEEATGAMAMGAESTDGLTIPAGSSPGLSMDGAHVMLTGLPADMEEGRLVPVTLTFEKAGTLTTRARLGGGMSGMAHDVAFDVPEGEPRPTVSLSVRPDGDGWIAEALVSHFQFSKDQVDGEHAPGLGHGHLYLNGLKLQRIYEPNTRIGALLPGDYTVRVTLNTNDHRPYAVDGEVVTAVASFTVD